VGVLAFTLVAQYLIVQHAGEFAQTIALSADHWALSVFLGSLSLPFAFLVKLVRVPEAPLLPDWLAERLLPKWLARRGEQKGGAVAVDEESATQRLRTE